MSDSNKKEKKVLFVAPQETLRQFRMLDMEKLIVSETKDKLKELSRHLASLDLGRDEVGSLADKISAVEETFELRHNDIWAEICKAAEIDPEGSYTVNRANGEVTESELCDCPQCRMERGENPLAGLLQAITSGNVSVMKVGEATEGVVPGARKSRKKNAIDAFAADISNMGPESKVVH